MAKLLSQHGKEHFHVHAFFGLLTLVHFLWRFSLLIADVENAGFGVDLKKDIISLLIIALPHSTSFLFSHVPVKKGTDDGFTIWKEYRWHAFIFSTRCWVTLIYFISQLHFFPEEDRYTKGFLIATVYSSMFAAKTVTDWFPKQSSTIRGMYKTNAASTVIGFAQYLLTAATIIGTPMDDIGVQYVAISIIQLNAFNMTLRKKRIIGGKTSQAFYTSMISFGVYLFILRRDPPNGFFDPRYQFVYLALTSYFARRFLNFSRFLSWAIGLLTMEILKNQFGLFL